jgi:hypothetical protein
MPLVFAHPELLHTALYIASSNLVVIGGTAEIRPTVNDATKQKVKLLQCLNAALSIASQTVNPSTVLAVAGISHIAVRRALPQT